MFSAEAINSQCQGYAPRPRGEYLPRQALSLVWVLVRSLVLIGLNLLLIAIIGIVRSGKKTTCTQKGIQSKA
jgi:hypothetical protein